MFILIHTPTGEQRVRGDTLIESDGFEYVLEDFTPPAHAASTGRVYVQPMYDNTSTYSYFPQVFNCKIVEVQP